MNILDCGETNCEYCRKDKCVYMTTDKNDVLDKIRSEIERLHHHPKLDFIKNDEVVEMALDIINKYKVESENT